MSTTVVVQDNEDLSVIAKLPISVFDPSGSVPAVAQTYRIVANAFGPTLKLVSLKDDPTFVPSLPEHTELAFPNILSVVHLFRPTVAALRAATQALAARDRKPFNRKYHGLIDSYSLVSLADLPHSGPDAYVVKNPDGTVSIPTVAIVFRVTEAVRGAIVFSAQSDPLTIESR